MNFLSLLTLKYSLCEWKELIDRKLFKADLNYVVLLGMFSIWKGRCLKTLIPE